MLTGSLYYNDNSIDIHVAITAAAGFKGLGPRAGSSTSSTTRPSAHVNSDPIDIHVATTAATGSRCNCGVRQYNCRRSAQS
ncbi:unnamed protein product [Tilletia controversa]|nr:unnamed protein product [Tilletia controversa]CAD6982613.1 unnamed protein product [Tilletia controversa]